MIYPGLSRSRDEPTIRPASSAFAFTGYRPLRMPIPVSPAPRSSSSRVHPIDDLPPLATVMTPGRLRSSGRDAAPSQPPSQAVQVQRVPVPAPAPAPAPAPPAPSTAVVEAKPRSHLSKKLGDLEEISLNFAKSDINPVGVLAEAMIFFGLVMLNWSSQLTRPDRWKAMIKLCLVGFFFYMHPIYCVISVCVVCVSYAYFRLAYKRPGN